jgi:hypothetical protein
VASSFASRITRSLPTKSDQTVPLSEMYLALPWQILINLIEPYDPIVSIKGGRPPYPLATLLRIHFLHQWFSLRNLAMEEALIEVATIRRTAWIKLITNRIQAETSIVALCHLLEKHGLVEQIFDSFTRSWLIGAGRCAKRRYWMPSPDGGAQLNQEQGWQAGSVDASDQETEPVVFRHQVPRLSG